ncbi:GntR family transcriptional regulator [Aminobacter sp. LjRoot7]|uniref:GntR family transcriptional regulator n=1 Tax=Aminobacter sp. LjRoot7 TaxID=3342335 RepID=UPI003ECC225A
MIALDVKARNSRISVVDQIVSRLAAEADSGQLAPGTHLTAQSLADRLGVSRSPVNEALRRLALAGYLRHEANRGYYVDRQGLVPTEPIAAPDILSEVYFRLAEDVLEGRISGIVAQSSLRARYNLTQAQAVALTTRVVKEGWMEQRSGYGLALTSFLTTPDALVQSYRMRMALEPAALLEPGYDLDPMEAARCREVEEFMLAGGTAKMSPEELYDRGVRFHETIVGASGNPFFLDALRRVNSVRRLLAYRSMGNRDRYVEQARDHLEILRLLEEGRNEEASWALRSHLGKVIHNLEPIRQLLERTDLGKGLVQKN